MITILVLYCANVFTCILVSQDADDQRLEEVREISLTRRVVIIQKTFRGYLVRKWFRKLKRACVIVQKNWRSMKTRREYKKASS